MAIITSLLILCLAYQACLDACTECEHNVCRKCQPKYTLLYGTCTQTNCTKGCEACLANNSTHCVQCDLLHRIYNNTCLLINKDSCFESCSSCTTSAPNQCHDCQNEYQLDSKGFCTTTENCSDGCEICILKNTQKSCIKCKDPLSLIDYQCYSQTCDANCELCSIKNECVKCKSSYFLMSYNKSTICASNQCEFKNCQHCSASNCVECKVGYKFSKSKFCVQCHPSCKVCSDIDDFDKCDECNDGYTLNNGICILKMCQPFCLSCVDRGCLACSNGYFLQYGVSPSTCMRCREGCDTCDSNGQCAVCGPYQINISLNGKNYCSLIDCTPNCKNCLKKEYNQCLTCSTEFMFFIGNETGICFKNSMCLQQYCLKCYSNDVNACLECTFGKLLVDGSCYEQVCPLSCAACDPISKVCSQCSQGYLLKSPQCIRCYKTCLSCENSTLNHTGCTKCMDGYFLKDTMCITNNCSNGCKTCIGALRTECLSCSEGYYFEKSDSFGKCIKAGCTKGCAECKNSYPDSCTKCATGYTMLGANIPSMCTINKCHSSCDLCIGSNGNECILCKKGYHLLGQAPNICYAPNMKCHTSCKECFGPEITDCINCEDGYEYDAKSLACSYRTNCPINCVRCVGEKSNQCIECENDYNLYILNGKTYGECLTISCLENCKYCRSNQCIECMVGFYINNSKCIRCSPNCLTCNGPLFSDCIECKAGLLAYKYGNGNSCVLRGCGQNCNYCLNSSLNSCVLCGPSYINAVVPSYCYSATSNILNCEQSNQDTCYKCKQGFELYLNVCIIPIECAQKISHCNKCNTDPVPSCATCEAGYSLKSANNCVKCHANCVSCNGENEADCIECISPYYKYKSTEVSTCASYSCPPSCSACDYQNKCLTCYTGYHLVDGECITTVGCHHSCQACFEQHNPAKCKKCKEGLSFNEDNKCTSTECFSPSCSICDGLHFYNCLNCTSKNVSAFDGVACVSSTCDPSCNECVESSNNICVSCSSGYTNIMPLPSLCYNESKNCSKECELCTNHGFCIKCKAPYFLLNRTRPSLCVSSINCSHSCEYCISNYSCIECKKSYYLYEHKNAKICIKDENCFASCSSCIGPLSSECVVCKSGFTKKKTIGRCAFDGVCHSNCKECIGPLPNQCLTCKTGKLFGTESGYCVVEDCKGECTHCLSKNIEECVMCSTKSAPLSQYPTMCLLNSHCSFGCLTCFGKMPNECLNCRKGMKYKDGYCLFENSTNCDAACSECFDASNGGCYSCKIGELYQVNSQSYCKEATNCHETCKSCVGPKINECADCANSTYEQIKGAPYFCINKNTKCYNDECKKCIGDKSNQCVECSHKYLLLSNSPSICLTNSCYDGCKICASSNINDCYDCNSGYQKLVSKELSVCLSTACSKGCKQCIGKGQSDCYECNQGFSKNRSIPPFKCIECHVSCLMCEAEGPEHCTSCSINFEKAYYGKHYCVTSQNCLEGCEKCVDRSMCMECSKDYALKNGICIKCHSNCNNCTGGEANDCTACKDGLILMNSSPSYCVSIKCETNCNKCLSSNIGQCVECTNPYMVKGKAPNICTKCPLNCVNCENEWKCDKCKPGFYIDNGTCASCDSSCKTCSGSGDNSCLECKDGMKMLNSSCYYYKNCTASNCEYCKSQLSGCSKCGPKYGLTTDNQNVCQACSSNCLLCTDYKITECTSCAPRYYLSESICKECDKGCINCNEKGCNKCDYGLSIYHKVGIRICVRSSCLSGCKLCDYDYKCVECNLQFYLKENYCLNCFLGCDKCTDGESNHCLSCVEEGVYLKQESDAYCTTAQKCLSGCESCLFNSTCVTCLNGYFMNAPPLDLCILPEINIIVLGASAGYFDMEYNFNLKDGTDDIDIASYLVCSNYTQELNHTLSKQTNTTVRATIDLSKELIVDNCTIDIIHQQNVSNVQGVELAMPGKSINFTNDYVESIFLISYQH